MQHETTRQKLDTKAKDSVDNSKARNGSRHIQKELAEHGNGPNVKAIKAARSDRL